MQRKFSGGGKGWICGEGGSGGKGGHEGRRLDLNGLHEECVCGRRDCTTGLKSKTAVRSLIDTERRG